MSAQDLAVSVRGVALLSLSYCLLIVLTHLSSRFLHLSTRLLEKGGKVNGSSSTSFHSVGHGTGEGTGQEENRRKLHDDGEWWYGLAREDLMIADIVENVRRTWTLGYSSGLYIKQSTAELAS